MTVCEQRLADMREDLIDYIKKFIEQRNLQIVTVVARQTLITEPEIKDYNTCMEANKLYNLKFRVFIDLDDTYSQRDIYTLAKKYVRFLDTNMKKDMVQIAIIQKAILKSDKKIKPSKAYEKAIREFKEMKDNEQD